MTMQANLKLTPHQARLLKLVYDRFQLNGAELATGEKRDRYAAINKELAELHTKFSNNLLADEEGWVTYLTPATDRRAACLLCRVRQGNAAEELRQAQALYAVTNTRSSMDPVPHLLHRTQTARDKSGGITIRAATMADANDNNAVIASDPQAAARARRTCWATKRMPDWQLQDNMAPSPAAATELMEAVWRPAVRGRRKKSPTCRPWRKARGADITIEPWDYRFYAEKVRKAKYALDSEEVKPYLQLDKLREAMFYVAGELFGMNFIAVPAGTIPSSIRMWACGRSPTRRQASMSATGISIRMHGRANDPARGRRAIARIPRSTGWRRCCRQTTPTS